MLIEYGLILLISAAAAARGNHMTSEPWSDLSRMDRQGKDKRERERDVIRCPVAAPHTS